MKEIEFIWDESKNLANQKKHKVVFDEAKSVFYDENARLIDDPDHSEDEERFILLGMMKLFALYQHEKQQRMKVKPINKVNL